jgi:hypothetical protein
MVPRMVIAASALFVLAIIVAGCAPVQAPVAQVAAQPSPPPAAPAASAQPSPAPSPNPPAAQPATAGAPTPAVSTGGGAGGKDLVGWWWGSTGVALQFLEDGTYRAGSAATILDMPGDAGQFTYDGTQLTFRSAGNSAWCPGMTGTYRVEATGEGHFRLAPIQDTYAARAATAHLDVYFRQPPDVGWPAAGATPVAAWSHKDLAGLWRSSRRSLQLNDDGTFQTASAAADLQAQPDDQGRVEVQGTQVKFASNEKSASCPGQAGTYKLSIGDSGQLFLSQVTDPCAKRGGWYSGNALVRWVP